jgi:hypothetical protein
MVILMITGIVMTAVNAHVAVLAFIQTLLINKSGNCRTTFWLASPQL